MDYYGSEKRKINPRVEANVFSLFTFGYTLGLFKKGIQNDLQEKDLYEVIESCRSKTCGDKIEKEWNKSRSIYKLLWNGFGTEYVIIALTIMAWKEIYSISQPYGMSRLISYFEKGQTKISRDDAYYCAAIVIFLNVFGFVYMQNLHIYEINFAIKIRASLKSLLYRKALKLSPASFSETNLGNIVTILTKDINALEDNLWLVMDIAVFAIQTLTVCVLLWLKMSNAAFIGIGLLLLSFPAQIYLSTLLTQMRLKVGKNSDERIQVTQETLSAIKIIKMYTWERFFNKKIAASRNKELVVMMRAFYIQFVIVGIGVLTSKITFLVLILSYIWMGYTTSTELLFYVLSLYQQLSHALSIMIPLNLSRAAEFRAAFIRLNTLLNAEEIKPIEESISEKTSIELRNVSVKIRDKLILNDVSLKINNPGLTLISGAVGSGKSSLLKAILQDLPRSKGDLEIQGSISYASQDPWLFPSTIKQNILFGEKYEPSRYEEVIGACALKYDLSLFENGDETVVADRGLNLSKGQQSRINLARAVYRKSDIYLLDDSLTALDGNVQDFIFKQCIQTFLSSKTCILVTQNASHLEQASNVVIMDEGRVVFSGKPGEVYQKKIMDYVKSESESKDIETLIDDKPKEAVTLETEQQFCKKKIYAETKKEGKVELSVYKKYFQFGGGFIIFTGIILLYIVSQVCDSSADKLITQWIDLQQKVLDLDGDATVNETYYNETYAKKENTFNIYTVLVILKSFLGLAKFYALLRFCRSASINIHKVMASRVVNGVMSFFDTHFLGNILNRFSHDLNNIDESIPFVFPGLISVLFGCIGGAVLISTVNWLFLIPAVVLFVILYLIRMAYMPTGRSLKRLEAATKSPLIGHINSSLEGLTTIRAFKAEQILRDEFDRHQDLYTTSFFTLNCTMTAFGFFMDLFCSSFTVLVIMRFLLAEQDVSAGNVGLALTQVFMLTSFVQWGIRQWAQLENHMTSVERALEYTEIKQEHRAGDTMESWPSDGRIVYENVTLAYSKNPVLRNVNFTVKPKQKIGIVGRTGAGKSSIISTLFRLYDYEGNIFIDGVEIRSLSLDFLRKSIAIIPQDPILFSGTIRENIDPHKKHTDAKIWSAIERVKIKDLVPSLDLKINESGSSFSSGQRQQICLARAAIGKCKIVVLDEATANMDTVTDKMLHSVIDDIFSNCTILTIAHRLRSILNCDMVMVLDRGELVEFDEPKKLMEDDTSAFYRMCKDGDTER